MQLSKHEWLERVKETSDDWFRTNTDTIIVCFRGRFPPQIFKAVGLYLNLGARLEVVYYDTIQNMTKCRIVEPDFGGPYARATEPRLPGEAPNLLSGPLKGPSKPTDDSAH